MNPTLLLSYTCRWLLSPRGWLQATGNIEQAQYWSAKLPEFIVANDVPTASTRGRNLFGEDIPGMEIVGGVAQIPVTGVLVKGCDLIDKTFGFTDPMDVRRDIDSAVANGDVQSIELLFDSPGGVVSGIPGLATHVAKVNEESKPIYAKADGQLCSAAYWLAAGCYSIEATNESDIGSIGVYQPVEDYTRMYKAAGVDVELLKTGKYKGAGYPGIPITDDQKEQWQAEVDMIGSWFFGHVTKYRTAVERDTMQGQSFLAPVAAENGLIDAIT